MSHFYSISILLLILGAFAYQYIRRAQEISLLCKDGMPIAGTVTSKRAHRTKRGKRYYIRYEYTGLDGSKYNGATSVSYDVFNQYEEKSSIQLVVSKSKPSISALPDLIEKAKRHADKS